jgi:glycosyltransferase involved in cell wall biosynthesis
MKILIVGPWRWPHYEDAFARGLRDSNIEVSSLVVSNFFKGFFGSIQQLIPFPGFALLRLNFAIVSEVIKIRPDLVLFWRPTHVLPKTISQIESLGVETASYNNDDPFGSKLHAKVPWHYHFLWNSYIKCLPFFSYNFFYRKINCTEAKAIGAKHAEVLLPYFMPWRDHPVQLTTSEKRRYDADIVFVGHYEPDGREESIRALVKAGMQVKLWGGHYWNRGVLGDIYDYLTPIEPAEGDEYTKALCGAKVCLCFLSKLNRDTYTRRCFEIPACGKAMLAERTDDLVKFFKEDEEACFFSSPEEMVHKAQWLINNPDIRDRIAQAGLNRVNGDGHDVVSRTKSFLSMLNSAKQKNQAKEK